MRQNYCSQSRHGTVISL